MSSQIKVSELDSAKYDIDKIKEVLDLEKKYFDLLFSLFTSQAFIKDLKLIESEIKKNYSFLVKVWNEKNKIKIPAERLARQYIYKNLFYLIKRIYPSPISSDIAFITSDAVINIDVKTLDYKGNKGDINNLQFENNQSSFHNINLDADPNIPNSGVKVECLLPDEYVNQLGQKLPVLTYFLVIVYSDNNKTFQLYRGEAFDTIYLKCLPSGILSPLFKNDLINNFKTYSYFDIQKGFEPVFLTRDSKEIVQSINKYVSSYSDYQLIKGRSKIGAYNKNQIHPIYKTKGVSWLPVKRKDKKGATKSSFYLEAVKKGHTMRVSNLRLIDRYDSKDEKRKGIKSISLRKH